MSKYVIKAKGGVGWVQGIVLNNNNNNKKIVVITTDQNEAEQFSTRREAKNKIRMNRFATSNYEIEMLDDGKTLVHEEYGDE